MSKTKKKKMNPKTVLFFKIVGYISCFLLIFFGYFLYRLDVLPMKYLFLILGVLFFFELLSLLAIHLFKKPLKIVGFIFVLLFGMISGFGCYYTFQTDRFLNLSFRNNKLSYSTTYYVIANGKSEINSLDQLENSIAYLSNAYLIDNAIQELKGRKDIATQVCEDALTMFQDLKSEKLESILVEQTSYDLILEMKQGFQKEDFKVIDEFSVTVLVENDIAENDGSSYQIYIGGNDFTDRLIDFNMIVTINAKNHKILLTSIPRDYYIPVFGYNGAKDTLSFMGARGIDVNRRSLEDFLGIDLSYFIKIETKSLVGIVDEVGGIDYCSDQSFTTTHAAILDSYDDTLGKKVRIKEGCQHLNGIEALTVARERLAFPGGDRQRQKNCQTIIKAIFKQLISTNTITNYNNILNSLSNLYQTNIPRDLISDLIKETIDGAQWEIENQSLDGTDGTGYVHLSNLTSYVMNPDPNSVEEVKRKISDILRN